MENKKIKNKCIKLVALSCILICILITLSGCTAQEENDVGQKVEEELRYLDDKLVSMLNQLNHIQYMGYVITEEQNQESNKKSASGSSSNSEGSDNSQGGSSEEGKSASDQESDSSSGGSSSKQSQSTSQGEGGYTKYGLKEVGVLTGDQKEIDWADLKNTIELLYSTWTSILVDLHSAQIQNQDILDFSTLMDQTITVIKQENKEQTLVSLVQLYAYLPKYIEQYSKDSDKTNLAYTKYYILGSYALVEQDRWEDMKTAIGQAQTYYSNLMNKVNENRQNQTQYSKIYVLLNEMNGAINLKDKDVYYIKYKCLMENISHI